MTLNYNKIYKKKYFIKFLSMYVVIGMYQITMYNVHIGISFDVLTLSVFQQSTACIIQYNKYMFNVHSL